MRPENGQEWETATTFVVEFPVEAPAGAVFRHDRGALAQLEYVRQVKDCWTEHQPSVTIHYEPGELDGIIRWCRENREHIAGLSFMPVDDFAYEQPPYEAIDVVEWKRRVNAFPTIDFSRLPTFEEEDYTTASGEVACMAGQCETL
jgi:ribonucleoside-diphosphate reductase alpha chain